MTSANTEKHIIKIVYMGEQAATISAVGEYGTPNTTKLNEVISIYVTVVAKMTTM